MNTDQPLLPAESLPNQISKINNNTKQRCNDSPITQVRSYVEKQMDQLQQELEFGFPRMLKVISPPPPPPTSPPPPPPPPPSSSSSSSSSSTIVTTTTTTSHPITAARVFIFQAKTKEFPVSLLLSSKY